MQETNHESTNIIQITCVMNLLHRAALRIPSDPAYEGISLSQMASIGYIYFMKRDVYQRDLENHFELRRSTVSSSLSVLEKKGLIKRLPVSHDARLKKLVLTVLLKEEVDDIALGMALFIFNVMFLCKCLCFFY